jgi:two-component system nitrogen regulation sensor histidine kinase NtrY
MLIISADFFALYYLIFSVFRRIFIFNREKRLDVGKKDWWSGGRLHRQVSTLFSCIAVIPSVCVFGFSILFLNVGIDTLFKTPVKTAMGSAESVSKIYINHMKLALEDFIIGLGFRLNEIIHEKFDIQKSAIEKVLDEHTFGLDIDAMVFQTDGSTKTILGTSSFVLSLQFDYINPEVFQNGKEFVNSFEGANAVFAVRKIDSLLGIYLVVKRKVDDSIIEHRGRIKSAIEDYTSLAHQKTSIKFTFLVFFSGIVLFLLLASILVGVLFSSRIIRPVDKLINGASDISCGRYDIFIDSEPFHNELDILVRSFNTMSKKLSEQRMELATFHRQSAWIDIARKIAHEIKNPLTPINLSVDMLKRKYLLKIGETEIFENCLDTIARQVRCIENLITEFSSFARMPAPLFRECDIIEIVNDVICIHSSANEGISFTSDIQCDSFNCFIDPDKINQVLMNVVQNSVNSINESGAVKNEAIVSADFRLPDDSGGANDSECKDVKCAENKEKRLGEVRVSFYPEHESYSISVEDSGQGFSEISIERAFDPYYTTRMKGSGLGLAISYKIISEHRGSIKLGRSSSLGGASVSITIPTKMRLSEPE